MSKCNCHIEFDMFFNTNFTRIFRNRQLHQRLSSFFSLHFVLFFISSVVTSVPSLIPAISCSHSHCLARAPCPSCCLLLHLPQQSCFATSHKSVACNIVTTLTSWPFVATIYDFVRAPPLCSLLPLSPPPFLGRIAFGK